jgi:hypothetical protein
VSSDAGERMTGKWKIFIGCVQHLYCFMELLGFLLVFLKVQTSLNIQTCKECLESFTFLIWQVKKPNTRVFGDMICTYGVTELALECSCPYSSFSQGHNLILPSRFVF